MGQNLKGEFQVLAGEKRRGVTERVEECWVDQAAKVSVRFAQEKAGLPSPKAFT
ncbi:hypothetical protein DC3_22140 [Deinococcus cellulosilyticus NBRC 106333 = KACC 11606]|uniref:Uncharacterized protein n=1 Tax=Deinococcus cellulosilyticus (strain DSM 18568 / NBRC 106333 / KACC 11606 / 5516J-15) TaxID=1223518 RepID=A0A511N1A8_DEIC1|nr:hypothetical protein DC3_22140 [Deinococcus cellulosilyticus NBRC 106333 = KACC 11606]